MHDYISKVLSRAVACLLHKMAETGRVFMNMISMLHFSIVTIYCQFLLTIY